MRWYERLLGAAILAIVLATLIPSCGCARYARSSTVTVTSDDGTVAITKERHERHWRKPADWDAVGVPLLMDARRGQKA